MFLKFVLRNIYACLTAIMNGSPIPTALDRNPGIQEFEEFEVLFMFFFFMIFTTLSNIHSQPTVILSLQSKF